MSQTIKNFQIPSLFPKELPLKKIDTWLLFEKLSKTVIVEVPPFIPSSLTLLKCGLDVLSFCYYADKNRVHMS